MSSTQLVVYVLLYCLIASHGSRANVVCNHGLISDLCPSEAPICCLYSRGTPAACCPRNTQCRLEDGTCQEWKDKSGSPTPHDESGGDEQSAPPPANDTVFTLTLAGAMLAVATLSLMVCVTVWCVLMVCTTRRLSGPRHVEVAPLVSTEAIYGLEDGSEDEAQDHTMTDRQVCPPATPEGEGSEGTNSTAQIPSAPTTLQSMELCVVCLDSKVNCALLPCGHLCICMQCSRHVRICPLCRKDIAERKKLKFVP